MSDLASVYLSERGIALTTAAQFGVEIDHNVDAKRIISRLRGDLLLNGIPLSKAAKELIWFPVLDDNKDSWICRPLPTIDPGRKFLTPIGGSAAPFIPKSVRGAKPGRPIIFTEGPIKGIVCSQAGYDAIGLNGVWCAGAMLTQTGKLVLRQDIYEALDLRGRKAYICFDADSQVNPDVRHAQIRLFFLLSISGCEVYQLTSWDLSEGKGIDDYLVGQALNDNRNPNEVLQMLISDAAPFVETISDNPLDLTLVTKELGRADLSKLLREQLCKNLAKRLHVHAADLIAVSIVEETSKNTFETDPDPWEESVEGPKLFSELTQIITRHVIADDHFVITAALWILLTYLVDTVDTLPILAVVSPTKRCGKTRLLGVLSRLVRRALPASNITPAAMFSVIEQCCPTLLVDEVDSFLKANEELRGVINSGHTRDTAFVLRANNDSGVVERFSTWSAKALALIGKLPDTVADRSIMIQLRRKVKGESVRPVRDTSPDEWETIRRKIMRWATDNAHAVQRANPAISEQINDRAADNWRPLMSIAYAIGSGWPKLAYDAAIALCGSVDEQESLVTTLLSAIRKIYGDANESGPTGFLATNQILAELNKDKEAPWADWRNGDGISAEKLSRYLRGFGIKSHQTTTVPQVRGYSYRDLEPVFNRYL
jgi:hypothetical protein